MAAADVARLLTLAALWGGSFAFIRVAVASTGPLWLAASRVTLAFLALFAVAILRRNLPALRERWRDFFVLGVLNSALPFAFFCFAEQFIGGSTAAVLNATSPFFATLVAAIWLRDRIAPAQVSGMILGIGGVGLLVGWQPQALSGDVLLAVGACLAAALCYGISSVYAKARMAGVPSFATALYSQMAAALVFVPALPFTPLPGALTPLVAANIIALALASTAFAYLLYFRLIATIGPARALTVTFLSPLFGLLWGYLFLGESIGINMLAGCAMILLGTWLALRPGPRAVVDRAAERG